MTSASAAEDESKKMVDLAIAAGVNFFDTANSTPAALRSMAAP